MDLDGHFFSLEDVYTDRAIYFPFANDFGPPSIGQTYVFATTLDQKLEVFHYSNEISRTSLESS